MEITRSSSGKVKIGSRELEGSLAQTLPIFDADIIKPELVQTFLTTVGLEKNITDAKKCAHELINLYRPSYLTNKLASCVDFYARAELNLLYFNYLVRYCGEDPVKALNEIQDNEFWHSAFPNAIDGEDGEASEYEAFLPPLNGDPGVISQVRPIRRLRIFDLLVLRQKLLEDEKMQDFIRNKVMSFVDELGQNIFKTYDTIGIIEAYINQMLNQDLAEDWLALQSIQLDTSWLTGKLNEAQDLWKRLSAMQKVNQ